MPTNYELVATSGTLDLQHFADQTFTSPTPATFSIITGTSYRRQRTAQQQRPQRLGPSGRHAGQQQWTGGAVTGLAPATGSTVAGGGNANVTGTFTAGTVGTNETWSIKNTDNSALTTTVTTGGTVNVYNHSAAALAVASGNNQSAIVGTALVGTATLTDTAGNTPAPARRRGRLAQQPVRRHRVRRLSVRAAPAPIPRPASTPVRPASARRLPSASARATRTTVIGHNSLSSLTSNFTYNVYNHSAATLTTATGNNQSVFVNGSLAAATATLADTAGNTPAPLDVGIGSLNDLTGMTGSQVVASGGTGTYTATGFNTSSVGIGKTLTNRPQRGRLRSILAPIRSRP